MTPSDEAGALYTEHRDEIYGYLISYGLRAPVAQEIVQDTFMRLLEELNTNPPIRNPRAWLYRVAHNLAIDEHRRRSTTPEFQADTYLVAANLDNPELAAMGRERTRNLLRAFQDLSPQQRNCLQLRAAGLRYREIAEVLGIGVPTVGEFLQRAMKNLRKVLYG